MRTIPPSGPAEVLQTSPALFDTGHPYAGGEESRVSGADHEVTPVGALDASPSASDDQPVVEGDDPHPIDADDTSRCPTALWCDTCEAADDLAVGTAESTLGIFCVTLCGTCAESGRVPRFASWVLALARVHDHAEHLDCTVEDLAPRY